MKLIDAYFKNLGIKATVNGIIDLDTCGKELTLFYSLIPEEVLNINESDFVFLGDDSIQKLLPESVIGKLKSENLQILRLVNLLRKIDKKCPWTKEQNFSEIVANIKSEILELEEAFSDGSLEETASEIGDVVYTSMLAALVFARDFGINPAEIIGGVGDKITRRKPWLFTSEQVSVEEAIAIWAYQKELENKVG